MVHSFYCLGCGQENKENDVLYDITPVILGVKNDKKDSFFSIAVNLEQIDKWHNNKKIELSFDTLKALYSNKNNYFEKKLKKYESLPEIWSKISKSDLENIDECPDSVKELIELGLGESDIAESEERFRQIKNIWNRFTRCNSVDFRKEFDSDNIIVVGYTVENEFVQNARVCRRCGTEAFREAGSAEHSVVSFVGQPNSAKTCTIVALMHYIETGLSGIYEKNRKFWKNSTDKFEEKYPGCKIIALNLDDIEKKFELVRFEMGVAPKKTEVDTEKLYHIVFKIEYGNSKKILSIADLPGELFTNGQVDRNLLSSSFSSSLSSKALVLCVPIESNIENLAGVENQIRYIKDLQNLCAVNRELEKNYKIPIIFLFTMCDNMTDQTGSDQTGSDQTGSELYMFGDQIDKLNNNPLFEKILQELKQDKYTFYAATPCAAFGQKPHKYIEPDKQDKPNAESIDKYRKKIGIELQEELIEVEPKGIDRLLEWILQVSGCIGITANFDDNRHPMTNCKIKNYFIQNEQYRVSNPGQRPNCDNDSVVKEALARHVLFRNPGKHDRHIIYNTRKKEDEYKGILGNIRMILDRIVNYLTKGDDGSLANYISRMKKKSDTNAE